MISKQPKPGNLVKNIVNNISKTCTKNILLCPNSPKLSLIVLIMIMVLNIVLTWRKDFDLETTWILSCKSYASFWTKLKTNMIQKLMPVMKYFMMVQNMSMLWNAPLHNVMCLVRDDGTRWSYFYVTYYKRIHVCYII